MTKFSVSLTSYFFLCANTVNAVRSHVVSHMIGVFTFLNQNICVLPVYCQWHFSPDSACKYFNIILFIINGSLIDCYAVFQSFRPSLREREKENRSYTREKKISKQPQPTRAPTASSVGSCLTIIQISSLPHHPRH